MYAFERQGWMRRQRGLQLMLKPFTSQRRTLNIPTAQAFVSET